jgi:hypothetical protein
LSDDQHRLGRQLPGQRIVIGPGHHRERWREMHVSKTAQLRAGAPVRQIRKREMNHHRRRPGPKSGEAIRSPAWVSFQDSPKQNAGIEVGDDRAPGFDPLAAGKDNTVSGAVGDHDCGDLGGKPHVTPGRRDGADQGGHDRVGTAAADQHAEALLRHRFQVGKQRAAGDVGGKVEMHAPGRHHHLELLMREMFVEPGARRSHQQPRLIGDPSGALCPPGGPDRPQRLQRGHLAAEQRKEMRRIAAEGDRELAPALGVARTDRRDPFGCRCQILLDAEPASVGKRGSEAACRRSEFDASGGEPFLVSGKERRTGKQGEVHGVEVMPKTRKRDFAGLDRAAGDLGTLQHHDFPTLAGEMKRRREAVYTGTDHNGIV